MSTRKGEEVHRERRQMETSITESRGRALKSRGFRAPVYSRVE